MNNILRINKLVATIVIMASLMSCGGNKNGNQQENAQEPKAGQPVTEQQAATAPVQDPAVEELVKHQDNEEQMESAEEIIPVETAVEAYKVPSELKYLKASDDYIYEKFYPIGWSKDGHFAYVVEPPDEAAGLYFFKLVVRNMISDKDVYVWEPEEELESGSVKEIWKQYNTTFAAKLNEYKIIPQNDIKLLGSEFQQDDIKYKVIIENKMETDPDFGFEVVKTTNISIKSPELGSKQIFSYTENDYNTCLSRMIQGVIKSPYENRIAVFVRAEDRGYEGPPNVIKSFLVGSDLERSFKK